MENKNNKNISATEAASRLGISVDEVEKLARLGILHPTVLEDKAVAYSATEIADIKSGHGTTLSEEAAKIGIQIQRETVTSLSFIKKFVYVAGGGFLGYLFLVVVFAVLFSFFPLQTANWLGLISKTSNSQTSRLDNQVSDGQVLAAQTSSLPIRQPSLLQTVLSPVRAVSLGIVKYANPNAYAQVAKETILDTNDVLAVDNGAITPVVPIMVPGSSYLEIASSGLITNLNSEFLQGKKPGTNVGDIAIVGPTVATAGLTINPQANNILNGLTITNSGAKTLTIAGGKTLAANNTLTLAGTDNTTITFQGTDTYIGRATTDTLSNKTISGNLNTISDLTAGALTAGDFSSKIISGTYSLNITGSAGIATNFSGSLTGDVSGLQAATTVNKLKGVALGNVTAISGNLLIGSGGEWITRTLSGDATINSSGILSLKNIGTAGTYGAATVIPLITTDAQGRISNVTNTTISGLTTTNLQAAAGITNGQLANSSLTINTSSPLNGGGPVSLGGTLSLTCPTCLVSGSTLFSAAASSGSSSSISQGGTLTLAAGSNITTSSNASGTITLATSATPTFSTVNGLVLSVAADGFTLAGGTSSRTATISGADITIGSTIQPTSAGALSIQSNGANILTLDTGGSSGIQIGNTNASNLTIGRSGVTTLINGIAAVNNLTVGGGTTILKHLSATTTFDAANFSDCSTLGTVTVTGAAVGDMVMATPTPIVNGVETFNVSWNAYVSSANIVTIRGCTVSNNEDPANQTWRVDVWQH